MVRNRRDSSCAESTRSADGQAPHAITPNTSNPSHQMLLRGAFVHPNLHITSLQLQSNVGGARGLRPRQTSQPIQRALHCHYSTSASGFRHAGCSVLTRALDLARVRKQAGRFSNSAQQKHKSAAAIASGGKPHLRPRAPSGGSGRAAGGNGRGRVIA